jgi:Holliday junction resolvase
MPNTRYNRGATLERRLVADFRAQGYAAYRVAGSRGAADVIALKPGEVILAQAKTGGAYPFSDFGPDARLRLREEASLAGARAVLIWRGTGKRNYTTYPEGEWPGGL